MVDGTMLATLISTSRARGTFANKVFPTKSRAQNLKKSARWLAHSALL